MGVIEKATGWQLNVLTCPYVPPHLPLTYFICTISQLKLSLKTRVHISSAIVIQYLYYIKNDDQRLAKG